MERLKSVILAGLFASSMLPFAASAEITCPQKWEQKYYTAANGAQAKFFNYIPHSGPVYNGCRPPDLASGQKSVEAIANLSPGDSPPPTLPCAVEKDLSDPNIFNVACSPKGPKLPFVAKVKPLSAPTVTLGTSTTTGTAVIDGSNSR